MRTPEEIANNTFAYVRCHGGLVEDDPGCGLQPLTEAEYQIQLDRPNRTWCCPRCGNSADYSDGESERVQGVYDTELEHAVEVLTNIPAPVLDEIGIERERQKLVHDYDEAHDDGHDNEVLALVAALYALPAHLRSPVERKWPRDVGRSAGETILVSDTFEVPEHWPMAWHGAFWKPKDRRRDLIRAAALIVAEIERLDRKAAREKVTP